MEGSCSPGPWQLNGDYVTNDVGGYIAKVLRVNHEDEANARLIAAAPDLLSALLKVQEALANHRDNPPGRENVLLDDEGLALILEEVKYVIVDPAIAKATGQDS